MKHGQTIARVQLKRNNMTQKLKPSLAQQLTIHIEHHHFISRLAQLYEYSRLGVDLYMSYIYLQTRRIEHFNNIQIFKRPSTHNFKYTFILSVHKKLITRYTNNQIRVGKHYLIAIVFVCAICVVDMKVDFFQLEIKQKVLVFPHCFY